jgi:hypothetical protein
MYIDFGNAESIRTQHEVDLQRVMEARALRAQARQAHRNGTVSRYWGRLLCELDFQRVLLAERVAPSSALASSILRGDQVALFSAGRCG